MRNRKLSLTPAFILLVLFCMLFSGRASAHYEYKNPELGANDGRWVRILRNYTNPVYKDGYYYYFENKVGSSTYNIYRDDADTGEKEKLFSFKSYYGELPPIVTDGKSVIYGYELGEGTVTRRFDIDTGKKTTISDLRKYETSKSTDWMSDMIMHNNYMYYSKTRGYTPIKNIYRVNVLTGKTTVFKSGYTMNRTNDGTYVSGNYMVANKSNGDTVIITISTGSAKTVCSGTSKRVTAMLMYDNQLYTATASKKGSSYEHRLYVSRIDGSGVKRKAIMTSKYSGNDVIGISPYSIVFYKSKYSKRYTWSTEKYTTIKSRDMWFYVNYEMYFG